MRRPPSLLERPPQGWSSLSLFLGMLLIVGLSVADARPLDIEGQSRTGALATIMVVAGLVGFLLGRSTLGIVRSHILGAAAGACLLVLVVAAAAQGLPDPLPAGVGDLQHRLAGLSAAISADIELWLETPGAVPMKATFLVLGAICWTTGQFGAFSIFRYDRGGPAVLSTGVLLFLNVAVPALDPERSALPAVPVLALYSALAMLLLVRMQLTQQGVQWARRHIADTGEVARLFLRTGTLFVVLTVLGATSLTALAAPRPDIDTRDLEGPLVDLGKELSRWLAFLGVSPAPNPRSALDERLPIPSKWQPGTGTAFTAMLAQGSSMYGNYWWGRAFDRFDGGWDRSRAVELEADPWQPLPVDVEGEVVEVSASITPANGWLATVAVFGPAEPERVSRAVTLTSLGNGRGRSYVAFREAVERGQPYEVRSIAHDYDRRRGTLTADDLRAAGTDYPAWVRNRYLRIPDGVSWPLTEGLARRLARQAGNPYDQAHLLQGILSGMTYDEDISDLPCEDFGSPECLLEHQQGFCMQYATAMAMVLRHLDIPVRFVEGYLPGQSDGRVLTVPEQALHAWVEVYFPDRGWIRFDPTPSVQVERHGGQVTDFPDAPPFEPDNGAATPSPTQAPDPTPEPAIGADESPDPAVYLEDEASNGDGGLAGTLLIVGGIVGAALLGLAGLLFIRLRRLAGADGGLAYLGIVSLASRLGYGPHPSQTEYEYVGTLSETLPSVRGELYLVADTHVETTYGRRPMTEQRIAALRRAYGRIRTALLRLAIFRRD